MASRSWPPASKGIDSRNLQPANLPGDVCECDARESPRARAARQIPARREAYSPNRRLPPGRRACGARAKNSCSRSPARPPAWADGGKFLPWALARLLRRRTAPPVFRKRDTLLPDCGLRTRSSLCNSRDFRAVAARGLRAGACPVPRTAHRAAARRARWPARAPAPRAAVRRRKESLGNVAPALQDARRRAAPRRAGHVHLAKEAANRTRYFARRSNAETERSSETAIRRAAPVPAHRSLARSRTARGLRARCGRDPAFQVRRWRATPWSCRSRMGRASPAALLPP